MSKFIKRNDVEPDESSFEMSFGEIIKEATLNENIKHSILQNKNSFDIDSKIHSQMMVKVLATTISNEMWVDMKCQLLDNSISFLRSFDKLKLHILPLQLVSNVMLNPDKHEIRIQLKPIFTIYTGWFTFLCQDGYDDIVEYLHTKSTEQYKQIVFEFKTKQQDKKFGLIDDIKSSKMEREAFVKREVKGGKYVVYKIWK